MKSIRIIVICTYIVHVVGLFMSVCIIILFAYVHVCVFVFVCARALASAREYVCVFDFSYVCIMCIYDNRPLCYTCSVCYDRMQCSCCMLLCLTANPSLLLRRCLLSKLCLSSEDAIYFSAFVLETNKSQNPNIHTFSLSSSFVRYVLLASITQSSHSLRVYSSYSYLRPSAPFVPSFLSCMAFWPLLFLFSTIVPLLLWPLCPLPFYVSLVPMRCVVGFL